MPEVPRPIWIESAEGLRAVAERCAAVGCIALDTEADSMHSYFHKVCLVQVTAERHHAVIDPLALAARDLEPLWKVVGDPAVKVLMHGADYDIRVLDRDYGAQVRGLEDTQVMAQLLGEPKTGLAALLEQELGVRLDKKHQRAEWGRRPLPRSRAAKIWPSGSRRARASLSRSAAGVISSTSSRASTAETRLAARPLTRYWRTIGGCLISTTSSSRKGRAGFTAVPATWTLPPRQAWLARLLVL